MSDKPKSKGGRPKADVDSDQVEYLASIGCSIKEIAAACSCSVDTLERRFADIIAKGQENGKTRLRKKQLEVAMGGNVVMLIWLGKQMLGQAEKHEITGKDGEAFKVEQITPDIEAKIKAAARVAVTMKPPRK